MSKVIGYVRVSTDKQSEKGVSTRAQEQKIRQYCQLYDLQLVDVVEDVFSAKTIDRPGFNEMLKRLRNGEADGFIFWRLDRVTRSVADLQFITDLCEQFKVISVDDQIDTRTASGRFLLSIQVATSQLERERISERTKSAMQYIKSQGRYTGGMLPFGKKAVNGEIVDCPEEIEVIELMRKHRAAGMSFNATARKINEAGYRTRRGTEFKHTSVMRLVPK